MVFGLADEVFVVGLVDLVAMAVDLAELVFGLVAFVGLVFAGACLSPGLR